MYCRNVFGYEIEDKYNVIYFKEFFFKYICIYKLNCLVCLK